MGGGRNRDSSYMVKNYKNFSSSGFMSRGKPKRFKNIVYRQDRPGNYNSNRVVANAPRVIQDHIKNKSNWYKFTVRYGKNYGKDFIIDSIRENLDDPFYPVGYVEEAQTYDSYFFVEGRILSETIMALDHRIDTPNGYKMQLLMRNTDAPCISLTNDAIEQIRLCLSKRYNPANKTLDLSMFNSDLFLREKGLFFPLYRSNVANIVIRLITENISEIYAIDMSKNRLHSMMGFQSLFKSFTSLRGLDLSRNNLRSIAFLDVLSKLPLVELNLDGNPLCDNYDERKKYISDVRKRFSSLTVLDKTELAPAISFDVDDTEPGADALPPSKSTFFCAPEYQGVSTNFLSQYLEIFDSRDRSQLSEAYHDLCRFSISLLYHRGENQFSHWISHSRNIKRQASNQVNTRIYQTRSDVIHALRHSVCATQHDMLSMCVDVPLANQKLFQITISGLLKERVARNSSVKAFMRTFVVVPLNGGFCVTNDMLVLSNATSKQIKSAFKSTDAATVSNEIRPPGDMLGAVASCSSASTMEVKARLIHSLMQTTGMNQAWAVKCLEENNFNYDRSLEIAQLLHAQNKIPPEAFSISM